MPQEPRIDQGVIQCGDGVQDLARELAILVEQVQKVHVAGVLHLRAGAEWLAKAPGRSILGVASEVESCCRSPSCLPPDFVGDVVVYRSIEKAESEFAQHRIEVDPRRIDVYDLGRTFCEVLGSTDAKQFMRSPIAAAQIPADFHSIVSACLGYEASTRFDNCEQLLHALAELENPCMDAEAALRRGARPTGTNDTHSVLRTRTCTAAFHSRILATTRFWK